jgi:hypothetical protein
MMSLETQQRIWQARIDPRRQTPSVGIYSHVLAGWGIFNAQPFVLNERHGRRQLLIPVATIILADLEPSSLVHHHAV